MSQGDVPWLDRAGRSRTALIGTVLFMTYGYFVAPAAWNETSRFNLTRSIVERARIDIDPYHQNTGDKSFRDGHYYTDKAPGASFLAALPYAAYFFYLVATDKPMPAFALRVVKGPAGSTPVMVQPMAVGVQAPRGDARGDTDQIMINLPFRKALYLCNLFTNAIAGAVVGAVFFVVLCAGLGLPDRQAFLATCALSVGSLMFPYATMFYGHVLAAACLFASFAILHRCKQQGGDPSPRTMSWAGVLAAAAVVAEFPTGVASMVLGVYALHVLRDRRLILFFATGAVAPAVLLFLYQGAAFGSPLRPGYAMVSGAEFARGMSQGFMGITYPKLHVLFEILFGRFRGLFYISPVLVLGFIGLGRLLRDRTVRAEALVCCAMVVYFVLMNSAYYMWYGGAALGPRHVIPMLPFLCVGIPFAVRPGRRRGRLAVLALVALSIFNQTIATAVAPEAPATGDPLFDHAYFHFFHGRVAVLGGTTNLGVLIGLPGPLSLLPLAVVWFLALRVIVPTLGDGDSRAAASSSSTATA